MTEAIIIIHGIHYWGNQISDHRSYTNVPEEKECVGIPRDKPPLPFSAYIIHRNRAARMEAVETKFSFKISPYKYSFDARSVNSDNFRHFTS